VTTPLVEGQTVKGESVVRLCNADSFIPRDDNCALVTRNSAEEAWTPVASLGQLGEILKSVPKDKLNESLGEWRDSRQNLFWAANGKVDNNEVTPFTQRWNSESVEEGRQFVDKGFRPDDPNVAPREAVVGLDQAIATVVPAGVKMLDACYPGKQVSLLEEPRSVSQHVIAYGATFQDAASYPETFGYLNITAGGVTTDPGVAGALMQQSIDSGYYFPVSYVMPEPKG